MPFWSIGDACFANILCLASFRYIPYQSIPLSLQMNNYRLRSHLPNISWNSWSALGCRHNGIGSTLLNDFLKAKMFSHLRNPSGSSQTWRNGSLSDLFLWHGLAKNRKRSLLKNWRELWWALQMERWWILIWKLYVTESVKILKMKVLKL